MPHIEKTVIQVPRVIRVPRIVKEKVYAYDYYGIPRETYRYVWIIANINIIANNSMSVLIKYVKSISNKYLLSVNLRH